MKANAEDFGVMVNQLATREDIQAARHEILQWMVTGMIAQTALLVGIIAFLR